MILTFRQLANCYQYFTPPGGECGLDTQIVTQFCADLATFNTWPATDQMGGELFNHPDKVPEVLFILRAV
jgi:hypothetical protein